MKKIAVGMMLIAFQSSFAQLSRNVGEFTSLKVYNKISVVLVPAEEHRVESGSADVEAVNSNGELKLRLAPAALFKGDQVSVKVYYQQLNDIQASQGSSVSSSEQVEARMLGLTANEGSVIHFALEVGTLNIKINSGGTIEVAGQADHQDIVVNSGGKFNGKNLEAKSAAVTANAGGIAEVYTSESVHAKTRAGGVIDVYGDPDNRQYKSVIGGKITFK